MNVYKALSIAGSDSGGGAGIQADLKTFQELGVYGMTVLTAITAQNTTGVQGVYPLTIEAVVRQLDSIGEDLRPDALKTGMLFSGELIQAIADRIRHYGWGNVVVDPVMIAKGGARLLQDEAVEAIRRYLLPLATAVTPNLPEAEVLAGVRIENEAGMEEAARIIHGMGVRYVVIKGGHAHTEEATDLLFDGGTFTRLSEKRLDTRHTHGTGCTFSAAFAAELAQGRSVEQSVRTAKAFIQAAIQHELGIGSGHGPTNHWAYRAKLQKAHLHLVQ